MRKKGNLAILPTPAAFKDSTLSVSRDEMNLAEFPLAVLSTRSNPNVKTLEFTDTVYSRDGKKITRRWVITGADRFGLPTASDDEVLIGLLKLTVDREFESRKVYFTRYELLKILRWSTEGRSYQRLQNALDRLSGVRIKAVNAFYDNVTKCYTTRNFGLIDAYEINSRGGRGANTSQSFFIWSEVLFKSFQSGFIKKLNLDFYLSLESSISKRLYRFLDKHFWYKSTYKSNLFVLAHEKIGISRNYRYPSSIRQHLDPAFEELYEKGFIEGIEYTGKGANTEITVYAKQRRARAVKGEKVGSLDRIKKSKKDIEKGIEDLDLSSFNQGEDFLKLKKQILSMLNQRGISLVQAGKLINGCSQAGLEKVLKIINYWDKLVAAKSHLVSKNKIGFLYKAVQNPGSFVLPEEVDCYAYQGTRKGQGASLKKPLNLRKRIEVENKKAVKDDSNICFYKKWRAEELQKLKGLIEPGLLKELKREAERELEKLKKVLSPSRFTEAVQHTVDEKIASLFSVMSFEEWLQKRRGKESN